MRVLLSTIGSRGDVQPLVAMALHLRQRGDEARLCSPPDFREWIEGLGIPFTPLGPAVRSFAAARATTPPKAPLAPEQRQRMAEATVATQFETLAAAAQDADVILAASALQLAARSIAEKTGVAYAFAAYAPNVLPSPHHAPPALPPLPGDAAPAAADNRELWARDAARFNDLFGPALNRQRQQLGLTPVADVRSHVFTAAPWLAADPTLGPWPDGEEGGVIQTGAWILEDERPLSRELEAFLDAGEPPIYFGFGSTAMTSDVGDAMLQAARALGRRAIVSQGWFDTAPVTGDVDCLAIGDTNLLALLPRVAAAVHHGGAGTTTASALGGAPQVIVPAFYDQPYWARQVERLGIGAAHTGGTLTAESLTLVLEAALRPEIAARAESMAAAVTRDGVAVAARQLDTLVGRDRDAVAGL